MERPDLDKVLSRRRPSSRRNPPLGALITGPASPLYWYTLLHDDRTSMYLHLHVMYICIDPFVRDQEARFTHGFEPEMP